MYIIIVGGGMIGGNLTEVATRQKNNVVVIEKDQEIAKELDANYDCLVINEDATKRTTLEEAGIEKADALIATTEDDAVNLVVTMFASDYELKSLVSIVHNKKNAHLFKEMGASVVENPELIIAQNLYNRVKRPNIHDFMEIGDIAEIFEVEVCKESEITDMTLEKAREKEILPKDVIVVALMRNNNIIIPSGNTQIKPGDYATILALNEQIEKAAALFSTKTN